LFYFLGRYGKPRAASVIAKTDGSLWALDRFIFVNSVLRTQTVRKDILRALRKGELLKSLSTIQLQRLVDLMSESYYRAGDDIIQQGEPGETFYVIVNGRCSVLIRTTSGEEKEVAILGSNDFFGERALLNSEPRAATVRALTDVEVLQV
jgi:cAMP-dependent protein kinase regulator